MRIAERRAWGRPGLGRAHVSRPRLDAGGGGGCTGSRTGPATVARLRVGGVSSAASTGAESAAMMARLGDGGPGAGAGAATSVGVDTLAGERTGDGPAVGVGGPLAR